MSYLRKFLFLLFLTPCFIYQSNAKNIELFNKKGIRVDGDTVLVAFHPSTDHGWTEIYVYLDVRNNTASAMTMRVKKTELKIRSDEYHSFCFANFCYDSSVYVSLYSAVVDPGKTDSSFSGHFRFDDLLHPPGECIVAYTFFNVNDPGDSSIVYVKYNTAMFTGVAEATVSDLSGSILFPNPANNFVTFNSGNIHSVLESAKLRICNTSGKEIISIPISEWKEGQMINISDLPSGVYFYSIVRRENAGLWKKLVVINR